jgi:phosphoglycolate phosphatase
MERTGMGSDVAVPSMRATTVLWDIDGTLVRSGGVAARAFLDAIAEVTDVRPAPERRDYGGRLDPEIADMLLAAVGAKTAQVAAVLETLQRLVVERLGELRAQTSTFPGVDALLAKLAGAGVRQTVVTGNLAAIARHKLEAGGLIPNRARPRRIRRQRAGSRRRGPGGTRPPVGSRVAARPREVWIVGDTPRDLACARVVGVRWALVATGRRTAEELAGLGADIVLPDLCDPRPLLNLWQI